LLQVSGFLKDTPIYSTNKTDCQEIAEILLKVALNTIIITTNHTLFIIIKTGNNLKKNYFYIKLLFTDKDHKYAINGYMQDWREWREDAGDAVSELFTCLKKVKREDIIYKICSKFREGNIYFSLYYN
jgi:hypothetical protein